MPPTPTITPLGDASLIANFGDDATARERVGSSRIACERSPLPGVTDLVPAFGVLGVHFDPAGVVCETEEPPSQAVARWLREQATNPQPCKQAEPRTIELPVCYDGPDLAETAAHAGISVERLVELHTRAEYRVGAIGFAPGFAYLEGLPRRLHTPRRSTPRTHVPAGSVAIGGAYTGVYPQDSPGGWNLIGRAPPRSFDPNAPVSDSLRVGDRVRMRRVAAADLPKEPRESKTQAEPQKIGTPVLRVVSPGVHSTLQDLGRPGRQAKGVSPGGAMDPASHRLANLLAGASENAAAIEATLVGPVLQAVEDVTLGIAGALPPNLPAPSRVRLRRGDQLDLRRLERGARCCVAIAGGFLGETPPSKRLAAEDMLFAKNQPSVDAPPLSVAPPNAWHDQHAKTATLRFLRGPQAECLQAGEFQRFVDSTLRVSPQSNRKGLRHDGAPLQVPKTNEMPSQPVAHGVIQVPPDGLPVVLGADRQTLGGYPVLGCVITADLPRLGQLRPGDRVRFIEVDLAEAERLRCNLERRLAVTAAGLALQIE